MSDEFDPYYKWLAIPPDEQPPDHYRLLGLRSFENDADVIANASDARMLQIRSYQSGANAKHSQQLLREISAARVCLLRPDSREVYDAELREKLGIATSDGGPARPAPPPVVRLAEPEADPATKAADGTVTPVRVRTTSTGPPPRAAAAPPVATDNFVADPAVVNVGANVVDLPAGRTTPIARRRKSNPLIAIFVLTGIAAVLAVVAWKLAGSEAAAPKIKKIDDLTANINEELVIQAELTDETTNESIEWSLDDPADGAKIDASDGELTWTPTKAGKFNFRVIARSTSDETVSDHEDFRIQVRRGSRPVSGGETIRIMPIADQKVTQGETVGFFVTLSEQVKVGRVRYRLTGITPPGASIDPRSGWFSWTPTAAQIAGRQQFTVTAESSGGKRGSDEKRFAIDVEMAPAPENVATPVVQSIDDKTVAAGETLTFSVSAQDPKSPQRELKYELDFPPLGATIDRKTGEFSWTPGERIAGRTVPITVRVTHASPPHGATTRTFRVTITGGTSATPPTTDANGVRSLVGHSASVEAVAIDRKAKVIASCTADGAVRLWATDSGQLLHESSSGGHELSTIAFSADGALVAAGGKDGVVCLWDVANDKKRVEFKGLAGGVRAIAFSPDGASIAAGSSEAKDIEMWDVATGEKKRTFKPSTLRDRDFVLCLAFRPDGKRLVAGRLSKTVSFWDVATGRELRAIESGFVSALAYRQDNRQLVWTDLARKLMFLELGTGAAPQEKVLDKPPTALAFDSAGGQIAAVLATRQIQVFDSQRQTLLHTLADASMAVGALALLDDGNAVLVGTSDKDVLVRTWKFDQSKP